MRRLLPVPAVELALLAGFLAAPASAQVRVPPGFRIDRVAGPPDLSFVTGIAFDGDGVLYATEANLFAGSGRVLRLEDLDGDGVAETIREHAGGFGLATGLAFRGERFPIHPEKCAPHPGSHGRSEPAATDLERIRRGTYRGRGLDLFVSHFVPGPGGGGAISRLRDRDRDGIADERDDVVVDLPSDGENGNQQIAIGPDGRLYFGQGGRTNAGVPAGGPPDTPLNGTVLAVGPDGSGLAVHARGLRNVFDLLFTPCGELIATENGPDPSGPGPVAGAPDELNAILAGAHYGWPDHFGFPPAGTGTLGPIAIFEPSSSTDGIALVPAGSQLCGLEGEVVAAQFGSFIDPTIGRRLLRIRFVGQRGVLVDELATGFGRPLDVAFGPDGALYVAEFSNEFFAPGTAVIWRISAEDADGDGTPEVCER